MLDVVTVYKILIHKQEHQTSVICLNYSTVM